MLIKICGLSNSIDAESAVKAGADALGFVMGGKVLPVEVEPKAQDVRRIIEGLPRSVDTFLVTHLTEPEEILELARYTKVSGIQISEPIGLDKVSEIRSSFGGKIIKTVVVSEESQSTLNQLEEYVDYLLLDTMHGGYIGGTGVISDWNLCKELVKKASRPVFLAGGLTPDNVIEGLCYTGAQGADVSTGVSAYSSEYLRKDRKDPEKIANFISLVRGVVR